VKEQTVMFLKFSVPRAAIAGAFAASCLLMSPALAQDPGTYSRHYRAYHHHHDYSGYLDPRSGHYDLEFQRNRENFGFSGRDPSRIGGEDPSLHPAPR
jgi:hypothetical protein